MAAYRANTDWISNLPPEIIEKILTLLPIRDAARTSILSRSWRYKWISMPDLNFGIGWGTADNLVKVINRCLVLHQGPIRRFSVRATTLALKRKMDHWMHFLSKQDIEELKVEFGGSEYKRLNYYRFPSCLFDCKKLTYLKLFSCKLDVPSTFEGFMNLKILKLALMVVDTSVVKLISRCPLLEILTLCALHDPNDVIAISAPKLKYLNLQGQFKDVVLESTPVLVETFLSLEPNVAMAGQGGYNLIKVFGGTPNLEKLTVPCWFEYFKIGYYPGAVPISFNYLKVMNLKINLEDVENLLLLLELLTSATNLEELIIEPFTKLSHDTPDVFDYDVWMKEHPLGRGFMKLKVMEMTCISCVPSEIEFAKFMLRNSPVLGEMKVASMLGKKVTASVMFKKLLKLPRASDRAAFTFSHKWREIKI